MSKSVAFEFIEGHEIREMGNRGAEDEGDEEEEELIEIPMAESMPISTPAVVDEFMFTDDFKRLLVGLIMGDTLMTLRLATKAWRRMVDAFIDEGVESGAMIVRGEEDLLWGREERHKLITRVIFLLNITEVGRLSA